MTDAKRGKVRNDRGSLRESKLPIELQAIGRERIGRTRFHGLRNHTTDQPGSGPCCRAPALTSSLA